MTCMAIQQKTQNTQMHDLYDNTTQNTQMHDLYDNHAQTGGERKSGDANLGDRFNS